MVIVTNIASAPVALHLSVDGFTQMEWIKIWVMIQGNGRLRHEHSEVM